jgi:hypothetical protein
MAGNDAGSLRERTSAGSLSGSTSNMPARNGARPDGRCRAIRATCGAMTISTTRACLDAIHEGPGSL